MSLIQRCPLIGESVYRGILTSGNLYTEVSSHQGICIQRCPHFSHNVVMRCQLCTCPVGHSSTDMVDSCIPCPVGPSATDMVGSTNVVHHISKLHI